MKRFFLLLTFGCLVGLGTHTVWYQMRQPAPGLTGQLEWMRRELHLSPAQYARIKALHESSSPRLLLLAQEVERMQGELAAFEAERQTQGRIDFVEFAQFVENRRNVSRECLDSTRTLINSTAQVMDEHQRTLYLAWLGPLGRQLLTSSVN